MIDLVKKDESESEEVILVNKFEDVYSCQKIHLDAVAARFEDPCLISFAVNKPLLWRNRVFEEATLI